MKYTKSEREAATARLREYLNPGDTVHTALRTVARSGMSRTLDVFVMRDNEPIRLTYATAVALGYALAGDALRVPGCGFDAGFEVVYNIGRALWPEGYTCIGKKCQSNDHSNGDRDYTPHHHRDGGYGLRQRWL